jgi:polar amino acid transport system substrate-binding protein
MTRAAHLTRRTATGLLLAGVLAASAACGPAEPAPRAAGPTASYDKALHDLLPAAVRDKGVLVVGTDASYAPMSTFAPDGRTIIGMEPDLGRELGQVLGVKVRFVNEDFTDIIPEVRHGRLDLGMSAMTDTAAREKSVDFVNYFSSGTAIVVQRGNPSGVTDIQDLCGRTVAVEEGTTQVDLLDRAQSNCPRRPIEVRTFPTNSDALLRLRTGRAVAVLNDLPPAVFVVTDRRTASQFQLASTTQYEPGLYGVVVSRERRDLRDAVQGAFEELVRSKVYDDVLRRWSVQSGAVDRVTVNSTTS